MINRVDRMIEIRTIRSVQEIMDEIRYKKEKKESIVVTPDSIHYSNFQIQNDVVIINRNPHLFLPFRGIGQITLKLIKDNNDTLIRCKVDAFKFESKIWLAILGFVLFLIFLPFILLGNYMVLLFLLMGYAIIFLLINLSIKFNTRQLKESLNYILTDLRLT